MNAFRQLRESGIKCSRLGLGSMNFGTTVGQSAASELLDTALDYDINLVDTAETYPFPPAREHHGLSETYIGNWLRESRKRDRIVLVSKIAGPSAHLSYLRNGNLRFDASNIRASVEQSLTRLGTDYLDIALLHWPERATNTLGQLDYKPARKETSTARVTDAIEQALRALNELLEEGKVRTFGLSNETPWGVMRFLHEAARLDLRAPSTIQQRYSLLDRALDVGMTEVLHREGIGLMTYSPLAFGLLSHAAQTAEGHGDDSRLAKTRKLHPYLSDACIQAAHQYFKVAKDNELDLAQMAIAYLLTRGYVTSVLLGVSNQAQLANNIGALDIKLDKTTIKAIDNIHHQRPNPCL